MFDYVNPQNDTVALYDFNTTLTYADLYERVQEISCLWKQHNVRRMLLYSSNSIEWCIYYLAAFVNGLVIFVLPVTISESSYSAIIDKYNIQFIYKGNQTIIRETSEPQHPDLVDVSTVMFTSGTTGTPKGIMLTKDNILSNINSIYNYLQIKQSDNILIIKPFYHSSTLTGEFLSGIFSGASIFIYTGTFFAHKIIHLLNNHPISVLCGVPSMFASMATVKYEYHGKLRLVSISGSYAHPDLLERMFYYFNCDIYHVYGLTEASPRVTCLEPVHFLKKIDSIGKPIKNVFVEICDNNGELTTNAHITGEIVVSGPNIMKGYLDDAETREKIRNNKLYTGDIGFYDDDKFLYLIGRKDDMICRSGTNIFPQQIEKAIRRLDSVLDIYIFGVKDYAYSNRIIAYISTKGSVTKKDILRTCYDQNVCPPDEIVFMEDLPKTNVGKIDRQKIKQAYMKENK